MAWAMDWITPADAAQVEHLCQLEDRAQTLIDQLARDGTILTKPLVSPRGEVIGDERYEHPALRALRGLDKPLLELRKSLGLDPQSRARLRLAVEEESSELDDLKARREARLQAQRAARAKADPDALPAHRAEGWRL
jgi:P27 family predicted phage terminase small subunit